MKVDNPLSGQNLSRPKMMSRWAEIKRQHKIPNDVLHIRINIRILTFKST